MAGNPRSRGCNACRAAKKKCIVQGTPPCDRCLRLKYKCIGYGIQRLKFIQAQPKRDAPAASRPVTARSESLSSARWNQCLSANPLLEPLGDAKPYIHHQQTSFTYDPRACTSIPISPRNGVTALATKLTTILAYQGPSTSFHLELTFGNFLSQVPRYLGTSTALDNATAALCSAYLSFRARGHAGAHTDDFKEYCKALAALSCALKSSVEAHRPQTLAAIKIIMTAESLLGVGSSMTHAGGAARIIKCRGLRAPTDDLERDTLLALRGSIVIQAFALGSEYFDDREWEWLENAGQPGRLGSSTDDEHPNHYSFHRSILPHLTRTARLAQRTTQLQTVLSTKLKHITEAQPPPRLHNSNESISALQRHLTKSWPSSDNVPPPPRQNTPDLEHLISSLHEQLTNARSLHVEVTHVVALLRAESHNDSLRSSAKCRQPIPLELDGDAKVLIRHYGLYTSFLRARALAFSLMTQLLINDIEDRILSSLSVAASGEGELDLAPYIHFDPEVGSASERSESQHSDLGSGFDPGLQPHDYNLARQMEISAAARNLCDIARTMACHRPLGAAWMAFVLTIVIAKASAKEKVEAIQLRDKFLSDW